MQGIDVTSLRGRTAMSRMDLSRPMAQALQDGLISSGRSVFDYGCGRGGDVSRLRQLGYSISGWDPAFAPEQEIRSADVVNLGYVVNVIESAHERAETLLKAWELARSVLIVSARLDWEARGVVARPVVDGIVTGRGTFQKFYTQFELKTWIESVLGVDSHAAAPGVFYIFRNPVDAEELRVRQVRRPTLSARRSVAELLYEQHGELLQELEEFLGERGRLPDATELRLGDELVSSFGSVPHAFRVLCRATGRTDWSAEATRARENLIVYLGLAGFAGRPRMKSMPLSLQKDIRDLFGSYRMAITEADRLLFSLGDDAELDRISRETSVGKVLPDALYFHTSLVPQLSPFLRLYVGCGEVLLGTVNATLIKLHRRERKVSFLFYPEFDRDPHPALEASLRVDLQSFHIRFTDYRKSPNPPILHRKESFVSMDHPSYRKFARLTAQEEKADLLGIPGIGFRSTWNKLLEEEGFRLAGHRLLRKK